MNENRNLISTAFIRNRSSLTYPVSNHDWPFPEPYGISRLRHLKSKITIFLVGQCGKVILNLLNKPQIHNLEKLTKVAYERRKGIPLITVSNHESCIDDPFLFGMVLKHSELWDRDRMRWTLAAHDICFTKKWHSTFFAAGKGVPVVRGSGVYQKAIDFAIDRLNEGDWVHLFPEGKINMEREKMYRLKWGVGRIIDEVKTLPIVIPFWHMGMADVLPNHKPYIPRMGKRVTFNVGNPIDLVSTVDKVKDETPMMKRKIITDLIQSKLEDLREQTIQLHKQVFK